MPETTPVVVPMESVNDEVVLLVAWRVSEGEEVHEGQVLLEVETSKSVIEISAPASGRVWPRAQPGDSVPVGATVAHIGPAATRADTHSPPAGEVSPRIA
jgi:pyruvate/2-oxoglutarate dehydrogenase complex dihydrolipoamide acyltransferase (E2) component